jgi:hypothetical protein
MTIFVYLIALIVSKCQLHRAVVALITQEVGKPRLWPGMKHVFVYDNDILPTTSSDSPSLEVSSMVTLEQMKALTERGVSLISMAKLLSGNPLCHCVILLTYGLMLTILCYSHMQCR